MKKRWKSIFPSGGNMRKMIRCMKLTLLLLTCFVLQTFAGANAQTVTIKKQNATLEEVIWELKQQTSFSFMYNDVDIASIKGITLNETKVDVEAILQKCLKNTNLEYVVLNNAIVIKLKANTLDEKKSITLKGWVYDKQKEPLPGVTIKLANTIAGTATDNKGWFSLKLPVTTGTLEFSFVGFKTAKVNFTEQTDTLRIYLEEDIQSLDETVVVAYGNTTKREMTGAVSTIKADELKGIPSSNIMNLLQGRVAGMDVSNLAGSPGGGGTVITIRGYNSFDVEQGSRSFSNPLWIVDGVPLNSFTSPVTGTNLLAEINPDMIESIQILKDASSAAIYGSRAANGVIIVTTKKGNKNQKASFSANISQTWSVLPKLPTVTIGKAERDFRFKALRNQLIAYLDTDSKAYTYPTSLKEAFQHPSSSMDWFLTAQPTGYEEALQIQDSLNPFYNNASNFFPMYYETGKITNANIQTYGGGDKFTYGIGLGYYDESGIFKGTGFNRIDLTTNINVIPVNRLNIDLRFYLSLTNRKRNTQTGESDLMIPQSEAPSVETVPGDPWTLSSLLPGKNSVVWDNVLEKLRGTKEKNRSVRGKANFKIGYDIMEGLNISTSFAADYSIHRKNYFSPSYLNSNGYSTSRGETGINLMALNETMLNYKKNFNEEHNISFLAGFSYQYDQTEYNGGYGQKSPSDKIYYVSGGFPTITEEGYGDFQKYVALQRYQSDMTEKSLISYFMRLEYNYKQKYLLSASFRGDGSSTFGKGNRWAIFPSIAGGWTFTEEKFMENLSSWLNFGKIRASWGRSGMHFDQSYLALGLLNTGGGNYFEGESILTSPSTGGLYNEKLSWEETDQYDFGLDVDFLDYRLGLTLDYYYRYTDKMLMQVPLSGNYNGYEMQWRNAGAISNEGIELLVKYEIFREQDLYWKVSVNGAKNWNQFRKSYDGQDTKKWIIGKPLNGIYTLATDGYVNQQDELPIFHNSVGVSNYLSYGYSKNTFYKPGDYKLRDTNGDGMITEDDVVYQGSALPEITGGIVSEFRWKNFDLNLSMSFQIGRHILNTIPSSSLATTFDNSMHPLLFDLKKISFWEQPGDNQADYAKLQYDQGVGMYEAAIDRNVEKVNWLKMKTLSIGYSLPQSLIHSWNIEQIRFFVSGENLFTWTNYSGLDPETVDIRDGYDWGNNYPLARKFTLGLTVKF